MFKHIDFVVFEILLADIKIVNSFSFSRTHGPRGKAKNKLEDGVLCFQTFDDGAFSHS